MSRATMLATLAALVACGIAAAALVAFAQSRGEAKELRKALAAAGDQAAAAAETRIAALQARIAGLEDELARATAAQAQPDAGETPQSTDTAQAAVGSPSVMEMLKRLGQGAPGGASGSEGAAEGGLAGLLKSIGPEQMERFATAGATSQMNMMYGEFLASDALSEEKREALRALLTENTVEQSRSAMGALTGGADMAELSAYAAQLEQQLQADVAELLSPEELEAWNAYRAEMPRKVLAQTMDTQLGMFAPGLSGETRELARDVIVEEVFAGREQATSPESAQEGMAQMSDALARARERLAPSLTQDEMTQIDAYIGQMDSIVQMSQQWLGAQQGGAQP